MARLTLARITGKCIPDGDCLLWAGKVYSNGHPSATEWVDGKDRYVGVRRRAYEEYHGVTVPAAQQVSTCGHPACLAKKHLTLVTVSEKVSRMHANMDAGTKLARSRKLAEHRRKVAGKVSPEQVAAIRESEEGPYVTAKKLGVNGVVASRIKRGESYRDYGASPFAGLGAR